MPYQWIEPDLFLEHNGVAVYHVYDDGGDLSWYWYTIDPTDDNLDSPQSETAQFDVRDLPSGDLDVNNWHNHAAIIRQAIDAALITGKPAAKLEQLSLSQILVQAVETLFSQPSIVNVFTDTEVDEVEIGKFVDERKKKLFFELVGTARLEMIRFLVDLNEKKGIGLETWSLFPQRSDVSNRVRIEVRDGIVYVMQHPPGIEVEIIDYDLQEDDDVR